MSDANDYRKTGEASLRVLFCIGVSQTFFEAPSADVPQIVGAISETFADLGGRFGITVLGTLDDDEMMVGPSGAYPWTAYILADAPNLAAITAVCNVVREGAVGEYRLVPTSASFQPAAAIYLRRPGDALSRALALEVLRVEDGQIVELIDFGDLSLFARFGLADSFSDEPSSQQA